MNTLIQDEKILTMNDQKTSKMTKIEFKGKKPISIAATSKSENVNIKKVVKE
jgi:hypothetical protein